MYTFVNLWELSDHKLFDDIRLPAGIDKEILVNTIFDECAEFEPLTIDVDLMKAKINNFFAKNYDNFNRLYQYTNNTWDKIGVPLNVGDIYQLGTSFYTFDGDEIIPITTNERPFIEIKWDGIDKFVCSFFWDNQS